MSRSFSVRKCFSLIAAGMLSCAVTFGTVAGFVTNEVSADVVKQPVIDRHGYEYSNWSKPAKSYITSLGDNGYMTFEVICEVEAEKEYKIDYFDTSFNHTGLKSVEIELEHFGGFYSDGKNYYVFSGHDNHKESASVECFRLTKYDKDWNKLGSCGFYDCDTYEPFECGGASMASSGNYLLIKTNRLMYKSNDGLHHQSNITFSVDTSTMTKLLSPGRFDTPGYYSHSFNQFIRIDNNHAVSADHGDCYNRDIGVCYYKEPVSSSKLGSADFYTAFQIGGSYEKYGNYTGATLGGLEISSSSYLVVGSSVDQNNLPSDGWGRGASCENMNVFVSTVDKSNGKASVKWLTSDANSKAGYSNPFIVKVNDDKFVVLWKKGNDNWTVRYAIIDGSGNIQGSVKTAKGYLSECQPVLAGNKIVWYTSVNNVFDPWDINEEYGIDEDDDGPVYMHSLNLSDGTITITALYNLSINDPKNGTASIPGDMFAAGKEVTINYTPDEGFELAFILVNGKLISGKTFTMPAKTTTVTVNFKKEGSPNLGDTVTIDEISYQVTNSDTEGAGTVALTGVSDQVTSLVIPSVIDINGFKYKVTKVAARALFGNTTVKTVYIGANIVVIDINAFFGCTSLVKVSGGANLKVINQTAFARCPKLSSFTITSKVLNKIGPQAFYLDSKLKTISIKKTTKLTKSGVKKSLKGSKVKTVKVKKSKIWKYRSYFKKSNSGRKVKVKK